MVFRTKSRTQTKNQLQITFAFVSIRRPNRFAKTSIGYRMEKEKEVLLIVLQIDVFADFSETRSLLFDSFWLSFAFSARFDKKKFEFRNCFRIFVRFVAERIKWKL